MLQKNVPLLLYTLPVDLLGGSAWEDKMQWSEIYGAKMIEELVSTACYMGYNVNNNTSGILWDMCVKRLARILKSGLTLVLD